MRSFRYFVILSIVLSCSKNQDKILPTERSLTESVYSSVTIQPDSLYQVYAIVAGILDNNLVEEGDDVFKDEAIIQIINSTPKLNTQNARFALELAKENYEGSAAVLDGIKDEIAAGILKFKNDSIIFFQAEKPLGTKYWFKSRI